MRYLETRPSADILPYVHCLWELQGGSDALGEPIFPDGRIDVVVHLGDRPTVAGASAPQPDVILAGQMTTALRLRPVQRLHVVGVRFTPTGAHAWLALPAHEITDRVDALDAVDPRITCRLRDAVHAGATPADRVSRIERVLRSTLRPELRASRRLEEAVRVTMARSGCVSVDALAHACDVSARQLERQYLDVVGLSPKTFARTVRFQRALSELQRGASPVVAAVTSGFADQSHLAREFRRFAGVPAGRVDLAHVAFVQDAGAAAPAE